MSSNRPYLLRAVHEWICDNGLTPYVVVDAARPGVKVPPQAISEGRVVLNLAPHAVARLEIGNDFITCTARFGGVSQSVSVPVAAVQAIYARENGQGMLLADDAPGGAPPVESGDPPSAGAEDSSPVKAAPSLQAVPADGQQDANAEEPGDGSTDATDGNDPTTPRPKGKPTLRVIK
jgi:stringent starvation protein B